MPYTNVIPYLVATIGPDLSTRRSKLAYAHLCKLDVHRTREEDIWLLDLSEERLIEQAFGVTSRRLNSLYREQTFRISGGLSWLLDKRTELAHEILHRETRLSLENLTPGDRQAMGQKITALRRRWIEIDIHIREMELDRMEHDQARAETLRRQKEIDDEKEKMKTRWTELREGLEAERLQFKARWAELEDEENKLKENKG